MKRTLIRYKTRPELAEKNAQLIASVGYTSIVAPEGLPVS